jgi:hypothetical protein
MKFAKISFYNFAKEIFKNRTQYQKNVLRVKMIKVNEIFDLNSVKNSKKKEKIKKFIKSFLKLANNMLKNEDFRFIITYQNIWIDYLPRYLISPFFSKFLIGEGKCNLTNKIFSKTFQKILNGTFILLYKFIIKTDVEYIIDHFIIILFISFLDNSEQENQVFELFLSQIEINCRRFSSKFLCLWTLMFNRFKCKHLFLLAKVILILQNYNKNCFLTKRYYTLYNFGLFKKNIKKNKHFNHLLRFLKLITQSKFFFSKENSGIKPYFTSITKCYNIKQSNLSGFLKLQKNKSINKEICKEKKTFLLLFKLKIFKNLFGYFIKLFRLILYFNYTIYLHLKLDPVYYTIYLQNNVNEILLMLNLC